MLVVIVVSFICSSRLAFLIMTDLINLMRHFWLISFEVICEPLDGHFCGHFWLIRFGVICVRGKPFVHKQFFKKKLEFSGGFLSVPHLADIYAKNVDERGRNFMCKRTLPSSLVSFNSYTGVIVAWIHQLKNISILSKSTSEVFSTSESKRKLL